MGESMRHAGGSWWSPMRVLLAVTAVVFALGMVQKSGCVSQTWEDAETRYVQMCYSDMPYLYTGRGMAELAWPYSDDAEVRSRYEVMEYPAGIAYWAWGTAWVTHWLAGSPDMAERVAAPVDQLWGLPSVHREIVLYVAVNALGFAVLALITSWLLTMIGQRRSDRRGEPDESDGPSGPGEVRPNVWAVLGFAASPMLLATGLVNWDILAVVTVAAAMLAWSRGRMVWLGVAIGLGTAIKLYPLFLLGAVAVICLRRRTVGALVVATAAALVTWLVVNAPAMLTGMDQWRFFWDFNSGRRADLGSLWLITEQITGHSFTPHTINLWSWALFGLWCCLTLAIGLRARRTPTFAELGFVIVAGFLIVNKVYSPQYVLWLLPLAALARPKLVDQLVWQACELFFFAICWWYLGGFLAAGGGDQQPFYWLGVVVRVTGELWLVGLIVRSWWSRPEPADDPVVDPAVDPAVDPRESALSR